MRKRALLISALLLLLGGLFFTAAADARDNYDAPNKYLLGPHGKLIWSWKAPDDVEVTGAAWTRNLLYTSRTPEGQRIEASGTLAVPPGRAPAGGWPLVVFHHGTTGMADICAPSKGSSLISSYAGVGTLYTNWIKAGYAVALPDYQGLGTPGLHRYLVGQAEARSSLDIIPAAKKLSRQVGKRHQVGNRYALAGHSQGGQAALFSAASAPSYLGNRYRHVGTISYAPPSSLDLQASLLPGLGSNPSSLTALAMLIVRGANVAAQAPVWEVLSPRILSTDDAVLSSEGSSLWQQSDNVCLPQLGEKTSAPGGLAPDQFLVTNDWSGNSTLQKLDVELKKMDPSLTFQRNLLLVQGKADTTVLPLFTDGLAGRLSDLNPGRVTYKTYDGVDHSGILSASSEDTDAALKTWFGR